VHEPWWVKERSWRWRDFFAEQHHHPHGAPCDLDVYLHPDPHSRAGSRTRCYLDPVWRGRQVFCGCGMCTGRWYRRDIHRAGRTAWRSYARAARATPTGFRGDLDSPVYGRTGW
jgi:hypothetical protein